MRLEDIEGRATISVEEAGQLLSVSRPTAYALARNGDIPVLRLGPRRIVVPVGAFLRMCGFEDRQKEQGGPPQAPRKALSLATDERKNCDDPTAPIP